MAYEIKERKTVAQLQQEFKQLKAEIFEGVWLVSYKIHSQMTLDQIKQLPRSAVNESVKSYKTIDWMVEMVRRREPFDFKDGSHIQPVYEILTKYLACLQALREETFSLNSRFDFPLEDIVYIDELAKICFDKISNLYVDNIQNNASIDNTDDGFSGIQKHDLKSPNKKPVEISRKSYLDVLIDGYRK